jgi:hypothetical protein
MTAHHIRHHDIGRESITNNSDLIWPRNARVRMGPKVCHDFIFAAGFLRRML